MTERKGPAVLIHYDEQEDSFYFSTLPPDKVASLDPEALGQPLSVSILRKVDPAEAERRFGAGLLSLLNGMSGGAVGVRDYEALHREETESVIAELRQKAEAGDSQAQYDLHHTLFAEAMSRRSLEYLPDTEKFLKLAAAAGHARAIADLDSWPLLKRQVERRAKRADT